MPSRWEIFRASSSTCVRSAACPSPGAESRTSPLVPHWWRALSRPVMSYSTLVLDTWWGRVRPREVCSYPRRPYLVCGPCLPPPADGPVVLQGDDERPPRVRTPIGGLGRRRCVASPASPPTPARSCLSVGAPKQRSWALPNRRQPCQRRSEHPEFGRPMRSLRALCKLCLVGCHVVRSGW